MSFIQQLFHECGLGVLLYIIYIIKTLTLTNMYEEYDLTRIGRVIMYPL